jgi:ferredoxin
MTERKIINKASLDELFNKLKSGGKRIIAPQEKNGKIIFIEVSSFWESIPSGKDIARDYIQTTLSPKQTVFPRYEEILSYQFENRNIKIDKETKKPVPTVLFGVRPCDARSLSTLNAVFTWDYIDTSFTSKLENTTVISISCSKSDEYCFCTSVGGSPGDTAGSDILLTPLDNDNFLAEIITEKGKAILLSAPELFSVKDKSASGGKDAPAVEKEKYLAQVKPHFDVKELANKLTKLFDSDIWEEQSLRCLGCGTCAFVCPACTCFDIQDETNGNYGKRFMCWDSCAFALFTLHTSGHNPRETQAPRWRQRLMHKFLYQPERLSVYGCVGCGRCSRACPADMNLLEHLVEIMEAQ